MVIFKMVSLPSFKHLIFVVIFLVELQISIINLTIAVMTKL